MSEEKIDKLIDIFKSYIINMHLCSGNVGFKFAEELLEQLENLQKGKPNE